jgi:hypothetical protein
MPFQEDMPYALDFSANEVGMHEKVCFIIEYAFSRYMTYMRVDCKEDRWSTFPRVLCTFQLSEKALNVHWILDPSIPASTRGPMSTKPTRFTELLDAFP